VKRVPVYTMFTETLVPLYSSSSLESKSSFFTAFHGNPPSPSMFCCFFVEPVTNSSSQVVLCSTGTLSCSLSVDELMKKG
jgi:hypothetical protein